MPGGTVISVEQPTTVFISYRRQDAAGHAGRLADGLIAMLGRTRVFVDVDSIEPGHDFVRAISDALSRTDVLLVVIGRSWLTASTKDGIRRLDCADDFVRLELETAFRDGIRVVPLLVHGATMPAEGALPESLRPLSRCNAVVLQDTQWSRDLDHLAQKLGLHPAQAVSSKAASVVAGGGQAPASRLIVGEIPHAAASLRERGDRLQVLRECRATGAAMTIAAITGTRGVGKTQLAAAYAREAVAGGWPVVVWAHAEHEDQIITGLAEVADAAGVRTPESDSATAAKAALAWLRLQPGPCLLIYDNAESPDIVARWMPTVGNIQIVITTVRHAFANLGETVSVDPYGEAESLAYLQQRTGLDDSDGARAVAEQLGYLPLALAQAAAVTGKGRLYPSYGAYLARLRPLRVNAQLGRALGDPYPLGAAQALELSIEQLADADPEGIAAGLFDALCVLSPTGVDMTLLEHVGRGPADGERDVSKVGAVGLALLADRSLATPTGDGGSVTVHRLLQRVGRERLVRTGRIDDVLLKASDAIDASLVPRVKAWTLRAEGEHLIAQIQALWDVSEGISELKDRTRTAILGLRLWSVDHLNNAYDSTRAIELGQSVTASCEAVLGAHHPVTLSASHALANGYRTIGSLDEAIPRYERTIADRERALGANHPDTLAARNDLAIGYRLKGRTDEAVTLHERTLADRERTLGPDHPDTFTSRSDLAVAYWAAGRTLDAIPVLERNLDDRTRVLGPDHQDTLISREHLAAMYRMSMQLSKAIPLFESTLAARERLLGADHPDTLVSRNDLADGYAWAGRLSEAIELLEGTLPGIEQILGPLHPDTLTVRGNLGAWYVSAGRLAEASAQLERGLADCERALGAEHPDTNWMVNALGAAHRVAGRFAEAVMLHERSVATAERVFGVDSKATFSSWSELSQSYEAAGRHSEAILLQERATAGAERLSGPDNPGTMLFRKRLAHAYLSAGRFADAMAAYEHTFVHSERAFGADYPETLAARGGLGIVYAAVGRRAEALAILEDVVAARERVLSTDHPEIFTSRHDLACAYKSAHRVTEAIAVLERTLADRERVLSPGHPDIDRTRAELENAYATARGDGSDAAKASDV